MANGFAYISGLLSSSSALLLLCLYSFAGQSEANANIHLKANVDFDLSSFEAFIESRAAETDGAPDTDKDISEAVHMLTTYKEAIIVECEPSRFYSIDGKCNNIQHPIWGAAFSTFERELPNQYADGKLVPRTYAQGTNNTVVLPSARKVSTQCVESLRNEVPSDLHPQHSQNFMQFGQYFSHDLALTPISKGFNCCKELGDNGLHPDTFTGGPCYPILIPEGDRHFNTCMVFNRSVYEVDHDGIAQQFSSATHVIDQSTVYGSTLKFANSIRTFINGTLRTDEFGMLPQDNTQKCFLHKPLMGCPVAGDNRVSVFPGLTSTHLIFHLEHNRVANALVKLHPEWDDERLYQEARAIMIAETQNLVYKEYLPLVIGPRLMRFFGLRNKTRYDPTLNPGLFNEFQTAAFRFGHSQINNAFKLNPQYPIDLLENVFFRPDRLLYQGEPSFGYLFFSLMTHPGQKMDAKFAEGVTDKLFLGVDRPGHSTDLPARNIQRGRDHGLPPYQDYLDVVLKHFASDSKLLPKIVLPNCIAGLYRSTRDVDLFLGGLYEALLPGAQVGPVFGYLIGKQFKNLREGDRLFFDTKGSQAGFSTAQVRSIKKTRYSGIICRNSGLLKVPRNAFKIVSKKNPLVDCESIPDVDFDLW